MTPRSSIGLAAAALCIASVAEAQNKPGARTVDLTEIHAVTNTGAPDAAKDQACRDKYGEHLGTKVSTVYDIDPTTKIMTASSTVFAVPVELHPIGISGIYSFMSDRIPASLADQGVTRVLFSISTEFSNPESDAMMPLDGTHNCILSNRGSF